MVLLLGGRSVFADEAIVAKRLKSGKSKKGLCAALTIFNAEKKRKGERRVDVATPARLKPFRRG